MDSPQSVVSPFKNLSVSSCEPARFADSLFPSSGNETAAGEQRKEDMDDGFIGVLEVFIHQARDIHNICIYHKQDVYSKICLTSDPDDAVSTKIINGGGKNPVFNDNLRLNVRTVDSSLKCEIWMMSRVQNYLQDQLLGFALVPMPEILAAGGGRCEGKLEKEFTLSSTDLFHSPAGFVQLTISYTGQCPEVLPIPAPPTALASDASARSNTSDISESDTSDLSKIEFPDPKVMNENDMMVSEYFGMHCSGLDSQSSESHASSDNENLLCSETSVQIAESFSPGITGSAHLQTPDSPLSGAPGDVSSPASLPQSSQASHASDDLPASSKSLQSHEHVSELKEKSGSAGDGETHSSSQAPTPEASAKPVVGVNVEPEQKLVQQDIVDMYMKSMQQFTESLAKMKLPLDVESGQSNSTNSSTEQKLPEAKSNGSRVFYGSRAFF